EVVSAESNLDKKRLAAGQRLLELRARIEAGEAGPISWWTFYEQDLARFRSRKDAEKLMRMAAADKPEAAFGAERVEAKERMQRHRAENAGANVRSIQCDQHGEGDDYDALTEAEAAEQADGRQPSKPKRHCRTKAETQGDKFDGFMSVVEAIAMTETGSISSDLVLDRLTTERREGYIQSAKTAKTKLEKIIDRLRSKER